ncbi:unnamed protein product [Lactuca saligna]|uniref:Pectin acetylesterase n=1 Tax=Lactuca saligna TaxID=75948 RepID=A0AA35ZLD4_LACSI|nr:unnamed protein product [Lactuca saligna]
MDRVRTPKLHRYIAILCVILFLNIECSEEVDITIIESVASKGVVCLDGSPPAYQLDRWFGDGVNNWLVHIQVKECKFLPIKVVILIGFTMSEVVLMILNRRQCLKLGIDSSLLDVDKVNASHVSPCDIVAVIRPAIYKYGIACEELDQKYVMKDNFEMSLSVTFSKNGNETNIYLGRVTPSSRKDLHAFTYFYHQRDSRCEKHVVKVKVEASCEVHKWALAKKLPDYNVTYLPFQLMTFDFKGVDILIVQRIVQSQMKISIESLLREKRQLQNLMPRGRLNPAPAPATDEHEALNPNSDCGSPVMKKQRVSLSQGVGLTHQVLDSSLRQHPIVYGMSFLYRNMYNINYVSLGGMGLGVVILLKLVIHVMMPRQIGRQSTELHQMCESTPEDIDDLDDVDAVISYMPQDFRGTLITQE